MTSNPFGRVSKWIFLSDGGEGEKNLQSWKWAPAHMKEVSKRTLCCLMKINQWFWNEMSLIWELTDSPLKIPEYLVLFCQKKSPRLAGLIKDVDLAG